MMAVEDILKYTLTHGWIVGLVFVLLELGYIYLPLKTAGYKILLWAQTCQIKFKQKRVAQFVCILKKMCCLIFVFPESNY